MNHFCTYCDSGYAARLLCLHDSLAAQGEPFALHVLCFDDITRQVIIAEGRGSLVPHAWAELLDLYPEYAAALRSRSQVEQYFTSTPVIVTHCFRILPVATFITYLDADLYFFGPPSRVLAGHEAASAAIVPHRFPPRLRALERHGRYNVGWVTFRRDGAGQAALAWWRTRCLEWCRDVADQGRYADQGYLDELVRLFGNVAVLSNPGINAAPWNMDGANVTSRDGQVRIDGAPLLFYHFQGVRELLPGWFDSGLLFYATPMTAPMRTLLYRPYLVKLAAMQAKLEQAHGIRRRFGYHRLPANDSWFGRVDRWLIRCVLPYYRRMRGQLVFADAPSR